MHPDRLCPHRFVTLDNGPLTYAAPMMTRILLFTLLFSGAALADPPVIEGVTAQKSGETWRFDVTLRHPDTGWDHYADGWRVVAMDGTILGTRILHHPHVSEQPFSRSLGGVRIPSGTDQVQIEAKCSVDGWSGSFVPVTLN